MIPAKPNRGPGFPLTPDHRMLLRMRDTLYEGRWDDFVRDLQARVESQPHVFETVPDTPGMKDTIARHLSLIEQMRAWETVHQQALSPDHNQ